MEQPVVKSVPPRTAICIEHTGSYDQIGTVYRQLREWARKKGVKVTGPGTTIFHTPPSEHGSESAVFEVCLPVEGEPAGEGKVRVRRLAGGMVASVRVTGPYSQVPAHYTEMLAWLSSQGLEPSGAPREVYVRRPDASPGGGSESFLTEIQFPVRGPDG